MNNNYESTTLTLEGVLGKFDSKHSLRDYKFTPGLVSECLASEFKAECAELFSSAAEDIDVSAL